ncbi:MAG TPA: CHASE domain-containing protein [Rheinheimera sp.]|nr:CHASE domain-containing protein [Rheinheimera sp.]
MRKTLIQILLLALSYAVIGRLFVLLAIPPGFATAIFPSAGLAVVALLLFGLPILPGVFFGSLVLNLWIGFDNGSSLLSGLPIAFGVATGATLQALLAWALVRKFVAKPDELTRDTDVIKFMFLAGPIACVVNASFGVGSLYLNEVLAADSISYAWFTWWVGDALGVLIGAPLVFILLAPGRGVWRQRRLNVGVPLVLLCVGLIWMFFTFSSWEIRQRQSVFDENVKLTHENLESRSAINLLALGATERFFNYSNNVTDSEFNGFVSYFLERDKAIRAMSWNPVVRHAEREQFEQTLKQQTGVSFIFNVGTARDVPAADADTYVVIRLIEPMNMNSVVIGLNVQSNPVRADAIAKAIDTGKVGVTSSIKLAQTNEDAVLMFYPVFHGPSDSIEQRKQNIVGFVTGVVAFKPLIDSVLAEKEGLSLELKLVDTSNNNALLFASAEQPKILPHNLSHSFDINVGSRVWQVSYWLAAGYKFENADYMAFAALTLGLLFTSILGAFLLVMTGRAHDVNQLVTKRSAELKGVLDNALDTILTFDQYGKIGSINHAGEELLHYSRADLIAKPVQSILPALNHETYLLQDSTQTLSDRFDSEAVRSDGVSIPVEVALSQMQVNGARFFTVILHDLVERHKAERLKDDIISTVSHELRTPLTSIIGSLGIVNSGVTGNLPEKAGELINLAMQNGQRLNMLINDILELSKHQADNFSLDLKPLCLADFLSNVIKLNAGYASQYQVNLKLAEVAQSLFVMADEAKLMQVLSNLLSNAIKYSPTNGEVTVTCSLHDDKHVDIAVQDNGNGIPEEFHQFIFRRFSQADSTDTRRVGGTGLGLAIAKIIVEKHQGDIWFDTEQGKGTTFFVRLPLTEEHINDVEPV